MHIFNKLKKKVDIDDLQIASNKETKSENNTLIAMNNYMLSEVRKENLSNNSYKLSISKLSEISPITMPTANNIKTIIEQKNKSTGKLYRITNLGKNDSLKAMKDGKTFWGSI